MHHKRVDSTSTSANKEGPLTTQPSPVHDAIVALDGDPPYDLRSYHTRGDEIGEDYIWLETTISDAKIEDKYTRDLASAEPSKRKSTPLRDLAAELLNLDSTARNTCANNATEVRRNRLNPKPMKECWEKADEFRREQEAQTLREQGDDQHPEPVREEDFQGFRQLQAHTLAPQSTTPQHSPLWPRFQSTRTKQHQQRKVAQNKEFAIWPQPLYGLSFNSSGSPYAQVSERCGILFSESFPMDAEAIAVSQAVCGWLVCLCFLSLMWSEGICLAFNG